MRVLTHADGMASSPDQALPRWPNAQQLRSTCDNPHTSAPAAIPTAKASAIAYRRSAHLGPARHHSRHGARVQAQQRQAAAAAGHRNVARVGRDGHAHVGSRRQLRAPEAANSAHIHACHVAAVGAGERQQRRSMWRRAAASATCRRPLLQQHWGRVHAAPQLQTPP
jgi:hypothetical protein